jgi:small conductance mechanosensitive channel
MTFASATPSRAAPSSNAAAPSHPSLAESLVTYGDATWAKLTRLDPEAVALNAGFSALVLVVAFVAVTLLRRLFDTGLRRLAGATGGNTTGGRPKARRVAGFTWSLLQLCIYVCAFLLVLSIWGIDPWAWLTQGGGARLLRLAIIVLLATAAIEITGFIIARAVEGVARRSGDARRAGQIRTLGPLLKGSVEGVLIVVAVLTFLSELGVKVGPLLASAGVVGIAVGFGAQTLVKDFLTGLFLIVEDVVSVGDNVRIGQESGTVEAMTLRTIRLRNANGTLHVFPYSEAQVIHNRTKSFSSYLFEILVPYDTDIDRALEAMEQTGRALAAEPAFAGKITRAFEPLGVDRLDPTGVVLKGRIITLPREQWAVGREYNRRILRAFAEADIPIAYRPVGPPAPSAPTAAAPPDPPARLPVRSS